MGLGAYLSVKSAIEYIRGERRREEYEVRQFPERERREIYDIYREKGFEPPVLDSIVDHICADEKRWVKIMMQEELNLVEEETLSPAKSAFATGGAYVVASLMPVLPFVFSDNVHLSFLWSIALTIGALFFVGASKTVVTGLKWWRSGLEAMLIGGVAAHGDLLHRRLGGEHLTCAGRGEGSRGGPGGIPRGPWNPAETED